MPRAFDRTFRFERGYFPTQPLVGDDNGTVFRGSNLILKGSYLEVWRGVQDLSESAPHLDLTGTLATSISSRTITGTGTAFKTELIPGQWLIVDTYLYRVYKIVSNTSIEVDPPAPANASGLTGKLPRTLLDVDLFRGSLVRGSVLRFARGNLLAVGQGALRLNGATIPASGFTVTGLLQIAVYDDATGNYSVYPLGQMAIPSAPTAAEGTAGTRNMQAGTYSVRVAPFRSTTNSYGNPSEATEVTIAAAGNKIAITFPAMDTADGQDGWRVFGTQFATNTGITGPWFLVDTILAPGDVSSGGGTVSFEWRDGEMTGEGLELASFDNDPPPDAAFVASLAGFPVLVSCNGPGDKAPGPVLRAAKPGNIEAFPARYSVAVSPPETILGVVEALGRLYLMTENRLHIATLTGNDISPVTVRPFWKSGFRNARALTFVNGTLYGCTHNGATRSAADGDEGSEEHTWALPVASEMATWDMDFTVVGYDPINEAVCFFNANNSKNSSNKWVTKALMFMLREQAWSPVITIESTSVDMTVTGVATVAGHLYIIANETTYKWDSSAGTPVSWYLATPFVDEGAEALDKSVTGLSVTALTDAGGTVGVHGSRSGEDAAVATLEAGNGGSVTGAIPLSAGATVRYSAWVKLNVKNLRAYAVRIDGTWPGTGARHRVDEITVEGRVLMGRH